jgi:hypothetical protein
MTRTDESFRKVNFFVLYKSCKNLKNYIILGHLLSTIMKFQYNSFIKYKNKHQDFMN